MQMITEPPGSTKADPGSREWAIDDEVVRLREWATDTMYFLPEGSTDELTMGAAETCKVQIKDPTDRVSRLHARLIRHQTKWLLRDAGSKNGVWVDGARRSEVLLEPGLEIRIGSITLIAKSFLSIELRCYLARLLGWTRESIESVDLAMRSVRMAATRRAALVLCGEGDLIPIARSLHRHSRGPHRPFVVCDPRRLRGKENVRSAENWSTGKEALAAAAGGSLCVRSRRLPRDFRQTLEAMQAPGSQVQLIVCAEKLKDSQLYRVTPIVIPPLIERRAQIDHIIHEYAEDAMKELGLPVTRILPVDRAWIREHACMSLPDIEKATLRLVALRASRTLSEAAARLGMAPVSLTRWIGRRRMPMEILP